ncbi:unnamed protein product [Hymenolepis diminuta]|uniref:Uncharacterized protein n=1 Tax=Hymenolepis diminuta TaxID=6216 RepID=A0A564Y3Q1_HYMDI|nr:unnamed protein product [Hymenolepis diminuta]
MCEIVNLFVTSGSLWINIVCHQVAHPHQSEKLSVPRMTVAGTRLTRLILGTSPVHTVPSFSYNRPLQLEHTYNYVLTRLTNISSLLIHTNTHRETITCQINLRSLPSFLNPLFSLGVCTAVCSIHLGLTNS